MILLIAFLQVNLVFQSFYLTKQTQKHLLMLNGITQNQRRCFPSQNRSPVRLTCGNSTQATKSCNSIAPSSNISMQFLTKNTIIHKLHPINSQYLIIQKKLIILITQHTLIMGPEPDQLGPSKNHQLFCNPQDPMNTMVMLKNIQHMGYFNWSYYHDDGTGNQVYKFFPNYFILNNIVIAHRQKTVLHAMLKQKTDPQIMIQQFCKLARACYPDKDDRMEINQLKKDFLGKLVTASEIIQWYTKQTFFFKLLNRLLRAGKDSTEVYYCQHFTKLLTQAITQVYRQQKIKNMQQVSGKFKCYRGGYFSQKQIAQLQQNIGKHIETLGFMSTTLDKSVAYGFLGNGNAFVEIEVCPDTPKDEELDLGYAYCADYSQQKQEKQVLFNVLSSFQIESVEKFDYQGREAWNIQLKYGITYQMAHNYKQNKLTKGTAEQQQVRAILSRQNTFQVYKYQEYCLQQQHAADEYIWFKKTKISLLKSIPQLQQFGQLEQFSLYDKLVTDILFKGKQQKYMKQIEPKYLSSINSQNTNQSKNNLIQNLVNIHNQIKKHHINNNFESVQQLAKKWRQVRQHLFIINPHAIKSIEQGQIAVSVYQVVANIRLLDEKGDIHKLKQQIQAAQSLKQLLLTKYDRYHYFFLMLRTFQMDAQYNHGLASYEEWLEFQQQRFMCLNCVILDQKYTFKAKLVKMVKQANRHIQQKQWVEAVKLCAEFRDKNCKGREHQDNECFQALINQGNKMNNNLVEKIQILQACLSVKHPQHSEFYKSSEQSLIIRTQQQQKHLTKHIQKIRTILTQEPSLLIQQLDYMKQKITLYFGNDSMVWIANQCLIVNTFRMLGQYEDATAYFNQMKQQILRSKHPEYYHQLQLHKLERE